MSQVLSDDASPSSPFPLTQMVAAPLAGQMIGLNESSFVIAEWAVPVAVQTIYHRYNSDLVSLPF